VAINNPDKTWLVWTSFPIAEAITSIVAFVLMKRINKKKLANL
jgi:hypothetical protein